MIQRRLDWRSRILAWSQAQVGKPLVWGQTDCAALARTAIVQMFGEAAEEILPRWKTAREALTILQERGSIGTILEELGADKLSVPFLRAGDLVVSSEPEEAVGGQSVMVCIDRTQCLAGTSHGVVMTAPGTNAVVYSLWELRNG